MELIDEHKQLVIDAMEEVTVAAGDKVITQGELGDYWYVVERGALEAVLVRVHLVHEAHVNNGRRDAAIVPRSEPAIHDPSVRGSIVRPARRSTPTQWARGEITEVSALGRLKFTYKIVLFNMTLITI